MLNIFLGNALFYTGKLFYKVLYEFLSQCVILKSIMTFTFNIEVIPVIMASLICFDRKNTFSGFGPCHSEEFIENINVSPTIVRVFFRKFEMVW